MKFTCMFIAVLMAFAAQEANAKRDFITTTSIESEKFTWTIHQFSFISSTFSSSPFTGPTFSFCYANETDCANWNFVLSKSGGEESHFYVLLSLLDHEKWDMNTYVNLRLKDKEGSVIRKVWDWSNNAYYFDFLWESEENVSLNKLPDDVLVIEWEMVRFFPEKDIVTE